MTPTITTPGSDERIRVFQSRFSARQPLHDKNDCRDNDEGIMGRVARNGQRMRTGQSVSTRQCSSEQICRAPKNIASILIILRSRRGLSMSALARQSGVSVHTIKRIEARRHEPNLNTVLTLLKVLGQPLRIGDEVIA